MAKRRLPGDGMVRKRSDGYWEGNIVVGHKKSGGPIFRSVFARTQKDLLKKLQDLKEEYKGVELTEDSRMTLAEWLRKWLDEIMALRLRPSTLNRYRTDIENDIIPFLGDKQISRLTQADVQKLYNRLKESGGAKSKGRPLSDSSIRGVHMELHEAMEEAEKEHLIAKNPTVGTTIPRLTKKPLNVLNDSQLDQFIACIKQDPVWGDFFYTEITTGLRRGEICGLKWDDFDEKNGKLKVQRAVTRDEKGALILGDTKTETGMRTILLPNTTADCLRKRKEKALSEWIFPDPVMPEKMLNPGSAYHRLKTILKNNDLPDIRFHDLRHTFATHAQANKVDIKTLAGILGHTNASFTLDTYTHVTHDMQKHAAGVVNHFMTDILGKELKPWQDGNREQEA